MLDANEKGRFLYKYKAPPKDKEDKVLISLSKGMLWAANPKMFNDPFDCKIKLDSSIYFENLPLYKVSVIDEEVSDSCINEIVAQLEIGEERDAEIIQYIEQQLKVKNKKTLREKICDWIDRRSDSVGVISLSESNDSLLMWAHYAACHQGYCLKFAVQGSPSWVRKVIYTGDYPSLIDMKPTFRKVGVERFMDGDEDDVDVANNDLFCYKSEEWRYEREWRYLQKIDRGIEGVEVPVHNCSCGLYLVGAIFGANMETENKKLIVDAIRHFKPDAEFEEAVIRNNKFALTIIRSPDWNA